MNNHFPSVECEVCEYSSCYGCRHLANPWLESLPDLRNARPYDSVDVSEKLNVVHSITGCMNSEIKLYENGQLAIKVMGKHAAWFPGEKLDGLYEAIEKVKKENGNEQNHE